jgi:hypothetical protein
MNGACRTQGIKYLRVLSWNPSKRRNHSGDVNIDGRMILLKWILYTQTNGENFVKTVKDLWIQ